MSLKYFELLENIEPSGRKRLLELFNSDYYFTKFCLMLKEEKIRIDFSNVVDMFKYYGVQVMYGEDWYEKIQLLREEDVFGTWHKKPVERKLMSLLTIKARSMKYKKYGYIKDLLSNCDEIEFKWVIKILCSPQIVRRMVE